MSLAIVAGIAALYRHARDVNQTTIALTFLLAILAVSAVWGMAVSLFMSVAAMLALIIFSFRRWGHSRLPTRRIG